MPVDAYASAPHYAAHLQPIFDALPDKGVFWQPSAHPRYQWGRPDIHLRDTTRPVMVAAWTDAQAMTPSPLIYVEHGAGQTYRADPRGARNGSYAGGPGLESVRLFLCPSQRVACLWRDAYPQAVAKVVGCPRLDRWHVRNDGTDRSPTVAVTFHWDCPMVPETTSAWGHYDRILPHLAERYRLLGHGHPRLWGVIKQRWKQLGVEHTPDLDEVFERADLLVMDNSSAGYEFASLDRPVVAVNAPWYRRDVHHGLRFWDHPPGLQCDTPDDLVDVIDRALADPPEARAIRAAAVGEVYDRVDGHATHRAVVAIQEATDAEPV